MSLTTLKDDLLHEFREERVMISDQIELLDPLATSLRKPAAQRLLSSGTLIMTEFICYIISLGGIAFMAFMHKIMPFNVLSQMFYSSSLRNGIGATNLFFLILGIYGLAAIGVVLIFVIGRMAREIRLKNDILNMAGKDIKTIVGQHLERKAALDTIEQRHMLGMSGVSPNNNAKSITDGVVTYSNPGITQVKRSVNEVINPGFAG
jgi:hypothetical protein